jgi:hypothetical protein
MDIGQIPGTTIHIIRGNARFTFLGNAMIRLEYDPAGRFDDRPTLRALTMPSPQPFQSVESSGDTLVLETEKITVTYTGNKPFNADNLSVRWHAGNMKEEWHPGKSDDMNQGSIITMDHITRDIIAEGVHSAGVNDNDRLGELNLVNTWFDMKDAMKEDPALFDNREPSLIDLYAEYDSLPEKLKYTFGGWKKLPPGPVSRAGYWVLDETSMFFYDPETKWLDKTIRPGYQNIFFSAYGKDYYTAMHQYTALCGRIPLLPRWAFGPWHSRFSPYTTADIKNIVQSYADNNLPLDVLIIDMDWHVNGWCGWEWNTECIPDREELFAWLKEEGIHASLNVHDEAIPLNDAYYTKVVSHLEKAGSTAAASFEEDEGTVRLDYSDRDVWNAMRETCYEPHEELGVEFWWLDVWNGRKDGYNSVLWENHLVTEHLARKEKRPMILGRYAGIGSHRYPAYFSGDTASQWEVLKYQLVINVAAGNVGMVYFSHDLGGFKGSVPGHVLPYIDTELYIRWMQMGALSPVMRIHCDHGVREAWSYGEQAFKIVREAYHMHTQLVPYFYHLAREAYDTGTPVHLPLYFLFPDDENAYNVRDEYFLGPNILCAPVADPGGKRTVYIPEGLFYSMTDGKTIAGPVTFTQHFKLNQVPMYVKAGSIIPMQTVVKRVGTTVPDPLVLNIYPGGDDSLALYEDDGCTKAYECESYTRWPISLKSDDDEYEITLSPLEGTYDDIPEKRNVEILVHYCDKPASLEVKSTAHPTYEWSYDEVGRKITVKCTGIDIHKSYSIKITM